MHCSSESTFHFSDSQFVKESSHDVKKHDRSPLYRVHKQPVAYDCSEEKFEDDSTLQEGQGPGIKTQKAMCSAQKERVKNGKALEGISLAQKNNF